MPENTKQLLDPTCQVCSTQPNQGFRALESTGDTLLVKPQDCTVSHISQQVATVQEGLLLPVAQQKQSSHSGDVAALLHIGCAVDGRVAGELQQGALCSQVGKQGLVAKRLECFVGFDVGATRSNLGDSKRQATPAGQQQCRTSQT